MSTELPTPPPTESHPQSLGVSNLRRDASSVSLASSGFAACHVEDVNQPCDNPNCGLHSGFNSPLHSRNASFANLAALNSHHLDEDSDSDAPPDHDDSRIPPEVVVQQVEDVVQGEGLHVATPIVTVAEPTEMHVPEAAAQGPENPVDPPETAPVEASTIQQEEIAPSAPPPSEPTPDPAPAPPAEAESTQEPSQDDINWKFDNPDELQAHVNGPDPFEQLKRDAPARSSSFPAVPPLPAQQPPAPDEKSLLAMMSSEVAVGEGLRGPFDSPTAEQGGLFEPEDAKGSFFEQANRQDSVIDGKVMGGVSLSDNIPEEDAKQDHFGERYEEGVPLIPQASPQPGEASEKKEAQFFDDTDPSAEPDDFFGKADSPTAENEGFPGVERKSTAQVLGNHPYHSGGGVAASMSTVVSEVMSAVPDETSTKADEILGGPDEAGDDFFSQLGGGQPAPAPETTAQAPVEDDVAAKWKAALADDNFLDDDEGFLPSDDEGLLPDSDDELTKAAATPQQPPPSNAFPPNQPATTASGRYTPQPAAQAPPQQQYLPQQPYAPQQQQQWPPQSTPYAPAAQTAPALRSTGSGYFPPTASMVSPYAAFGAQPAPQPQKKVESFVDKTSGYQSPYDLPMDVAPVIKKRPSSLAQNALHSGVNAMRSPAMPPRSSSMGNIVSPPPSAGYPQQGPPKPKPAAPQQQQSFFEELPMAPPKARSSSSMGRYTPQPGGAPLPGRPGSIGQPISRPGSTQGFYGSPGPQFTQAPFTHTPQQSITQFTPNQSPRMSFQQPPPGTSPQQNFATLQATPPTLHAAAAQPMQRVPSATYAPPPPATSRYSPAPPAAPTPTSNYAPAPAAVTPPTQSKYAPRSGGPPQVAPSTSVPPMSHQQFGPPLHQQPGLPPQAPPSELQGAFTGPPSRAQVYTAPPAQSPYDPHGAASRASSGEYGMHSSRPGTSGGVPLEAPREEEEAAAPQTPQTNGFPTQQNAISVPAPSQSRYAPGGTMSPPQGTFSPPQGTFSPPLMTAAQHQMSPRKPSQPVRAISPEATFQTPPRAATQSPGAVYNRGKINQRPSVPYERPVSAFAGPATVATAPTEFRPRQPSVDLNFIPPDNETANDELARWKGAPVFSWGFGGNVTVMFPKRSSRYGSDQKPVIKSSPGEVKIKSMNDILTLEQQLEKFPGPVWTGNKSSNKTKKKEVLAYMDERIEQFAKMTVDVDDYAERKSAEEKTLLWKVVKVMIEHDGKVEGTPEIEKAVREVLTPEVAEMVSKENEGTFVPMEGMAQLEPANAERVDADALTTFRKKLLSGDRAAAVWHAVDKRLWAHALLISGTVGRDLWKKVVEEFVKNEVKTLGQGSESLAVLYETLAGNWEECVDELVPASARMGMPMLTSGNANQQSVFDRLNRWKETLGLILSNRSPGDQTAILSLGRLLLSYGRVYAAHICYIFARQSPLGGAGSVFGGPDDESTDFALLGADHKSQPLDYARDLDAIVLSEIYELAVSLTPHATTANPVLPHLQIYKLHHALMLAEHGRRTDAQKYCDSIGSAVKAWNKPSPYFHQAFFGVLEDLTTRLQEAPRESSSSGSSSSWIPKLASSSSMWSTFNKFVAGEEDSEHHQGGVALSQGEAEGPFGKITPGVSRVPSGVDLYGAYSGTYQPTAPTMGTSPSNTRPPIGTPAPSTSRYAPGGRGSFEGPRPSQFETRRASSESHRGYEPMAPNGSAYEPTAPVNPYEAAAPPSAYENQRSVSTGYSPSYSGRPSLEVTPEVPETPTMAGFNENTTNNTSNGYEPPSGGYEPPTGGYTPYVPDEDDDQEEKTLKPKKSFMDDDDDDAFLKANEKVKKQEEEEKRKKEEEEKKNETQSSQKKGWFGGFGLFKRGESPAPGQTGPIKAKLGEESSFVYDPDLKRWVNKKAGEQTAAPAKPPPPPKRTATPPVARAASAAPSEPPMRTASPAMPPPAPTSAPATGGGLAPPPASTPPVTRGLTPSPGPPSRATPMSRSSSAAGGGDLDDLLGAPSGRRSTQPGGRKKGKARYVEVIPGQQS